MVRLKILGLYCFAIVITVACAKTEIQEVHQPYIIEGNDPPDYSGVTTLQVQQYVSRLYIDLLGEQPLVEVMQEKVSYLQANDLNAASRYNLVQELMDDEAYAVNVFNYTTTQFLNGVSRSEIQEQIDLYTYIIAQYYDQGEIQLAQMFEYEREKFVNLLNAGQDLQDGTIAINEFYRRFCFNGIYDEINMGSENMVIACFENLFGRYPTNSELISGVSMVDGLSAVILQNNGNSKSDFVDIVTHTPEFYLGRVFEQYQRLLTREPNPAEEQDGTQLIQTEGFRNFQAEILITDAYANF